MLTKSPVVPSKDALKVLRQLALAGSTLGAIGVVTLNYNVHRRIRLAEQRLETKKKIRALSSGRGEAHMARVIETAEKGQDFTIRALREQRTRERYFKLFDPNFPGNEGLKKQKPHGSRAPHDEGEARFDRERTAHNIRRTTVTMTSTTPTRFEGRQKRFTNPPPFWHMFGGRKTEEVKVSGPSRNNNTSCALREEVVEKLKKATMAMTSIGAAHVYGRPKAVSKARPKLHWSVASWLGIVPVSQDPPDAVPALFDLSFTTTPDEVVPPQNNTTTSLNTEKLKRVSVQAVDHPGPRAAERKTRRSGSTFAQDVHTTPIFPYHQRRHISGLSQNTSSNRINDNMPIQTGMKSHMKPSANSYSLVGAAEALPKLPRGRSIVDTTSAELITCNVVPISDGMPNSHSGRLGTLVSPTKHKTADPESGGPEILTEIRRKGQSLPIQKTVSTGRRSHNDAKTCDHASAKITDTDDRTSLELKRHSSEASSPRQPDYHIQLQYSTSNTQESNFRPWPRLPLSDSHFSEERENNLLSLNDSIAEEQQRIFQEGADAQSQRTIDGQDQIMHKWTPFPRSSSTPERITGPKDLERSLRRGHALGRTYPRKESRKPEKTLDTSTYEANTIHAMTHEDKVGLALQVHRVFSNQGMLEGQRAWKATASLRLRQNDLAAVDFLYEEFVGKSIMSMSPRHHIVQSLIQWHYERSTYSARAAEILFPDLQPGMNGPAGSGSDGYASVYKKERLRSLFAIRFLQGLWETKADPDWLLVNFRRVVVAAKLRGLKLVEEIFAIVIRSLASIGDMPTAQAIYDEMVFYHQIEASFLTRTLLLRGYARICDWHRVEREVEALHHQGLSRSRPHGYALMINAVLQEYEARSTLEQFQNFLINAISYWGLLPTSSVSITTVRTYLSQNRYDLVREWMETLQVLFPQIETETRSFQWLLGNFWQRAGSSCQEIEEAIKALTYRKSHTRLKSVSLPIIHEAISRDLTAKLDAAKAKTEPGGQPTSFGTGDNDFMSTNTVDEHLTSAFSLAASTVSQNRKPTPELIELHRQATAVHRLNSFLTGTISSEAVEQFTFPDDPESGIGSHNANMDRALASVQSNLFHLQGSIPKVLTTEFLPETSTITSAILEFYRTRFTGNLPTDHTLLSWVCEKLLHADRAFDAIFVLQNVYGNSLVRQLAGLGDESGHGTGSARPPIIGFGIQFYEFWMRLAWVTKSLVQWQRVVEEVLSLSTTTTTTTTPTAPTFSSAPVDAGSGQKQSPLVGGGGGVRITASFLFLTRSTASRGLKGRWSRWKCNDRKGPAEEVVWLVGELEKRREAQIGRKEERRRLNVKLH